MKLPPRYRRAAGSGGHPTKNMSTTNTADPAKTNTETAQTELRGIGLLVREHAESEDLSTRRLLEAHPKLGSDQTLSRICAGQWDKVKAEDWLEAYRAVLAFITDQANDAAPLYDDLSTAKKLRGQFSRLKLSRTAAKLVIVEGFTGAGKTTAGQIVAAKYNAMAPSQQVFTIEASAGWGDRPNAMLAEMLKALGRADGGRSQASRLEKLVEVLAERPAFFVIDEVHDFGVRCLRVIKTLLNRTGVKIVLLCHPRLFRDLERDNWDDLSQLTGNRLLARIDLGTLEVADVATIVARRVPALAGIPAEQFTPLAQAALQNGNLAFVREVVVRLQKEARKKPHLTMEDVTTATTAELKARGRARK